MKKFVPVTILVFVVGIAGVQDLSGQSYPVDRGSLLIGGGASLTSSKTTYPQGAGGGRSSQKSSYFSVRPSVQYFVVPGLALGGDVAIRRWNGGRWSLGGGPALTYFFLKGERPWNLYLSGSFHIGKTWEPNERYEDPKFHSYRGALGTVFMVSKGVGIHTEAFYSVHEENEGWVEPVDGPGWESKTEQNSYGLSVGISVFVF